jgi:putative hydrolase of the HAD superfamily
MSLLFVFDMDDVLYDYDWRTRMAGLTALTGLDLAELRRRWWNDQGEWAAEAGRFRDAEHYHQEFQSALGASVSVEAWVANRRSAMTPWPDSIDVVRRAAGHGRVSLLTNNGPLAGAHLGIIASEIAPLFGEHLRTSSWYGARKPDPVVFDRLLEEYEADPDEVFFADDLAENVAGAASRGITAHRFTDPESLRRAVEDFAARPGR